MKLTNLLINNSHININSLQTLRVNLQEILQHQPNVNFTLQSEVGALCYNNKEFCKGNLIFQDYTEDQYFYDSAPNSRHAAKQLNKTYYKFYSTINQPISTKSSAIAWMNTEPVYSKHIDAIETIQDIFSSFYERSLFWQTYFEFCKPNLIIPLLLGQTRYVESAQVEQEAYACEQLQRQYLTMVNSARNFVQFYDRK